jgi:hypothetical protein
VACEDVRLLEEADRAVYRGDADMRVDLDGAAMDLLDIRMIGGVRQDARDHPALLRHLQSLVDAELLEARDHAAGHSEEADRWA